MEHQARNLPKNDMHLVSILLERLNMTLGGSKVDWCRAVIVLGTMGSSEQIQKKGGQNERIQKKKESHQKGSHVFTPAFTPTSYLEPIRETKKRSTCK